MKKFKGILTGTLLIMTLGMLTACGNNNNAADVIFPVLGYGFYHKRELIKQNILNIGMLISILGGLIGILLDIRIRGGANFEMMHQFFIVLPSCAIFYLIISIKENKNAVIQILRR